MRGGRALFRETRGRGREWVEEERGDLRRFNSQAFPWALATSFFQEGVAFLLG